MSIRKPSPSLVVACLALLLGTTGTATAAKKLFTGADIQNRTITRLDVAKATLTGENVKPGSLLPAHFKGGLPQGPQGPAGPQGPQGEQGQQGQAGVATAYAHVNGNGTLDAARTKGITGIARPSDGVYCFDLTGTATSVVATVDLIGGASDAIIHANVGGNAASCPGAEEASVRIYDVSAAAAVDRSFYVIFN